MTLRREMRVEKPRDEVFAFFANAENLGRITPPELNFQILTPLPIQMEEGTLIDYRLRIWGVPVYWQTLISSWDPPHSFVDEQLRGPYREWIHTHRFEEDGSGTLLIDEVRYRIPFGPLGALARPLVVRQVEKIFDHRNQVTRKLFS
ncbi:MAG: SRPBCC family protein [marine benthic group bacterium]|jgi:ligand-binding SRPBCC domain-containing protein|nr:SRPBCC family protein [Candidatus Benthicola marisminoris]